MSKKYQPDDICFYCVHTFAEHTLIVQTCATCAELQDGMPRLPGHEDRCTRFRKTDFCGECGARIAWDLWLNKYHHADQALEDDHMPYARRKSRV